MYVYIVCIYTVIYMRTHIRLFIYLFVCVCDMVYEDTIHKAEVKLCVYVLVACYCIRLSYLQ